MISKLETNEMQLNIEQFNIVETIKGVFDLLEMNAKKNGIQLIFDKNYDIPILVLGDEMRIEQVLVNLLVNSIKYGRINGITKVSIESQGHDKVLIKIKDNGFGIKKEQYYQSTNKVIVKLLLRYTC